MMQIKKNDTVIVIAGKDKSKQGTVIAILPKKGLIKVKDVALATKHKKARRQGEASQIKREESYINISNVMLLSTDSKPCRVNFKVSEDGKKARVCKRTNEIL
ncbi:50S ribosomal protein L24 [Candidatus Babela massiliensis]|uniref:Large ribosomal subunit protein uL24 n=1 Tax=Candidatus Babela massiliensis TaxID=673862 RepID=V6DFZ2_9BACT|nr:50S ribosomal protein L24 [Candidatus Babela massiliensis]CDK30502.1 Ribosomal protein L24 [Candidatus Babela massiliensis]